MSVFYTTCMEVNISRITILVKVPGKSKIKRNSQCKRSQADDLLREFFGDAFDKKTDEKPTHSGSSSDKNDPSYGIKGHDHKRAIGRIRITIRGVDAMDLPLTPNKS